MPLPTPFHSRTSALCETQQWRDWSGYLAASAYQHSYLQEYWAIRNSAGLIDVSPLYKYEVSGPDAQRLVDRVMTRNIGRCRVGQVMYSPWCDDEGKIVEDGTISRLEENRFRLTAADRSLRWFRDVGYGLDAEVKDVSMELAALALQGPNSREILKDTLGNRDVESLRFFRLMEGAVGDFRLTVTRTGYTGDLGYELWVDARHAESLWDRLMEKGRPYGILPAGMVALDMVRIEAGLLLIEVDFFNTHKTLIEEQKSSPYEVGLGWAVALKKKDFIGRRALIEEKKRGSPWTFVGLEIDWDEFEDLFAEVDLPPRVEGRASRAGVPLYRDGSQIGQATSRTFSPVLKKYIGIGTVQTRHAQLGREIQMEVTVEYARRQVSARVVKTPFFDPPRKRA